MARPLRNQLTVRLAVALSLSAAGVLAAAGIWNLRLQRSHLTGMVVTSATQRAEDIRRATRDAMLRNQPGEVRTIIETLVAQPSIERIRVFDKRGRIGTSSDPGEIGTQVDTVEEHCVACHLPNETLTRLEDEDRVRTFTGRDGGRVLGVVAPILNEPACSSAACHAHPASRELLGVLDVQLSLREVDRSLAASERQALLGLLGTTAAVLALGWFLIWRMVLRPVGKLTVAAAQVAGGDLAAHIPVQASDEIGEMTEAWNTMIAKLGRAQVVLERWNRTLEQRVEEKTRELEEAHRRMLLVEKMASLGKLSAVMAHEINNPLTGIGTYARLLRRKLARDGTAGRPGGSDLAETDRILRLVEEEAARCGKIVHDLLLFSRQPGAAFEKHPLGPILERCAMLLRHQAERREVRLEIEVERDLPSVTCQASQIEQMLLALALNAIQATPAGGNVSLSARRGGTDGVILGVRDTGHGIADADLDRIFEPFFTTKEEGSGVGLGLAVVYGIVERHGGSIDVESPPGGGTLFTVRLPLRPATGTGADRREEMKAATS